MHDMKAWSTVFLGIARSIALAVVLLCVPFAAAAGSNGHDVPEYRDTGIRGDTHANVLPCTMASDETPALPLHCHLAAPQPQEIAPARITADIGLAPFPDRIRDSMPEAGTQPVAGRAHVPIPVPSRFILFGNFRS